MGGFKEYLALLEAKHIIHTYGAWGIITKEGKIVDGTTHPTHSQHLDLAAEHRDQYPVEYFHHEPTNQLIIRTWSVGSLGNAIKHFNKLPHGRTGIVYHEHSSHDPHSPELVKADFHGKRYEVLSKMKALHTKLTGGSLTEMAQDPHKAGYQFHVIHDGSNEGIHAIIATHPSAKPTLPGRYQDMKDMLPKSVKDHVVGFAEIQHRDGAFKDTPHNVRVLEDHRRKGVAAGLYDKYQEYTGRPVRPSPEQTGAARSFWKDRVKS